MPRITFTSSGRWPARTAHDPSSGTTTTGSARPARPPRNGTGCGGPPQRTAPPAAVRLARSRRRPAARDAPRRPGSRCGAATAAAGAGSEEEFFARLHDAGVLVRARYSTRNPGQVTGYAVALTGDTTQAGRPVWFGGAKLAADLSLPKLRARWGGASTPARPSAQFTAEERNAIWEHAARTAHDARERIRRCAATDPSAAADAAWAASDTLHAAAAVLGSRVIRQAADSYARAARVPYARVPRRSLAGSGLRQAARLLSRTTLTGQLPASAQAQLVTQLAALVDAVTELRQAQRHAAQAAAARRASEHLHAERRRLTRRTESRATRSARLAAEDFPAAPWARVRAPGAQQPGWTGPRASRGPTASRPRGPTR